jgi:ParB family chromosome partitioning protein
VSAEANALQGRRRLTGAFQIEIGRIRPDSAQPRRTFDPQSQEELVASIRRIGLLQPITVRYLEAEDIYQIIAGERRYQACRTAGLTELPCWVQSPKAQDILLHQIVENWQRADLNPYELADALATLRDANGYSQKDLAKETGKPESEISRLLSLLKLEEQVQQTARADQSGTLTKRHLFAVAQLPAPEQVDVLRSIQEKQLTAQETERVVKEKRSIASGRKTRGTPLVHRLRYRTARAVVTLDFRKRTIEHADIFAALDEVRRQVEQGRESSETA